LSDDKSNDLKTRLSQDVTLALNRMPVHDVPTMNYYASEGSAGSGLDNKNSQMVAWFDKAL
jgi:hypothetical protein